MMNYRRYRKNYYDSLCDAKRIFNNYNKVYRMFI